MAPVGLICPLWRAQGRCDGSRTPTAVSEDSRRGHPARPIDYDIQKYVIKRTIATTITPKPIITRFLSFYVRCCPPGLPHCACRILAIGCNI